MKSTWRALGTIAVLSGGCGEASSQPDDGSGHPAAPSWPAETVVASETDYATATTRPPSDPPTANLETELSLASHLPNNTPAYFKQTYASLMKAPLPAKIYDQGGVPKYVAQYEVDRNPRGFLGSYQPNGPTETSKNAFFKSLGTNGRACITCHQPPSGMSVSVRNIKQRLEATDGRDPIFAPVDGANCPSQVANGYTSGALYGGKYGSGLKDFKASHSLLIDKGLIRIALPVPANAEFTVEVVSDPTTCNLDPTYNSAADGTRILSMFRRPLIASNLNFKTNTVDFFPPGFSPLTNIMFDGREPTLASQAINATLGHAQGTKAPTQAQVDEMVAFEVGIFNAQWFDDSARFLDVVGAKGGPVNLASHGTEAPSFGGAAFDEFDAWSMVGGYLASERKSIARGEQLFHGKGGTTGDRGSFVLANVAGFNDFPGISNPLPGQSCATCHNFGHAGSDILARSQRDIGIGGQGASTNGPAPASDLPTFKVTCPAGSFLWDPARTTVTTNDLGKAMMTGKCRDVGSRTVPSLRALAAHEPYFSDGSAATLMDVVNVYDKRFSIGLTKKEKNDLVNFLGSL
jgi:cytochrome c peroxidase